MRFESTPIAGVWIVIPEIRSDNRGFFSRIFSRDDFERQGLPGEYPQVNVSFNNTKGTLRGMHFAVAPSRESKLIRCTHGSAFDVLADLRPDSPSFLRHASFALSSKERILLYVPQGVAHGFLTREDNTELEYHMSENYQPQYDRGVRWNDPALGVVWPEEPLVLSDRDRTFRDFIPE